MSTVDIRLQSTLAHTPSEAVCLIIPLTLSLVIISFAKDTEKKGQRRRETSHLAVIPPSAKGLQGEAKSLSLLTSCGAKKTNEKIQHLRNLSKLSQQFTRKRSITVCTLPFQNELLFPSGVGAQTEACQLQKGNKVIIFISPLIILHAPLALEGISPQDLRAALCTGGRSFGKTLLCFKKREITRKKEPWADKLPYGVPVKTKLSSFMDLFCCSVNVWSGVYWKSVMKTNTDYTWQEPDLFILEGNISVQTQELQINHGDPL